MAGTTVDSTIEIHKILRAKNPPELSPITPENTTVSVRNSLGTTVHNNILIVQQPVTDATDPDNIMYTDGFVKGTVPLEVGSNSITLTRASEDDLNIGEYLVFKEGSTTVSRVVNNVVVYI